jgi:hypothetical protein
VSEVGIASGMCRFCVPLLRRGRTRPTPPAMAMLRGWGLRLGGWGGSPRRRARRHGGAERWRREAPQPRSGGASACRAAPSAHRAVERGGTAERSGGGAKRRSRAAAVRAVEEALHAFGWSLVPVEGALEA